MTTARYAVIGSPIAHSLSPQMQQAAFDAARIDARYEAIDTPLARLEATMHRLRAEAYAGWNVTTPLKEAVLRWVDAASDDARRAQAANTIVRSPRGELQAANTDGLGFVNALADLWDLRPKGLAVLILGAGPAARAIAGALRDAGARSIACWSRSQARARAIGPAPGQTADLIVAAVPPGASIPEELRHFAGPKTYVFDLNYGQARSAAQALGGEHRSDGRALLLHQGALAFEQWTGEKAPLAAMRAALARQPR